MLKIEIFGKWLDVNYQSARNREPQRLSSKKSICAHMAGKANSRVLSVGPD